MIRLFIYFLFSVAAVTILDGPRPKETGNQRHSMIWLGLARPCRYETRQVNGADKQAYLHTCSYLGQFCNHKNIYNDYKGVVLHSKLVHFTTSLPKL